MYLLHFLHISLAIGFLSCWLFCHFHHDDDIFEGCKKAIAFILILLSLLLLPQPIQSIDMLGDVQLKKSNK
jgi:hypothetical protein